MWRPGSIRARGPRPESIVWIFGHGRSGTTWLAKLLGELDRCRVWHEPLIGLALAAADERVVDATRASEHYIFGEPPERRAAAVRGMFLAGAAARLDGLGRRDLLVVKEPHGTLGAPRLVEAFPESRMIVMLRDPRDVFASVIDAYGEAGWGRAELDLGSERRYRELTDPEAWGRDYRRQLEAALAAFDAHEGRRALLRYEDLWVDAASALRGLLEELGIPMPGDRLRAAVDKHAWERVPAEQKGPGRFHRRGEPGGWREELSAEQAAIVERHARPILDRFYDD